MSTATKVPFTSFLLYTGYVEDQSMSGLLLTHCQGFPTVQEALMDLVRVFRECDESGREHAYIPKCCQKTKETDKDADFCSKCGRPLAVVATPIEELIRNYVNGVIDGSGDFWQALEDAGWSHQEEDFDWPNHVTVESIETVLEECEKWKKGDPGPEHGAWDSCEDYAKYHVHFFNKKMESRMLK